MKFQAALLTALTIAVLLVVYVIGSFTLAYPESGFIGWVWVVAAIAVLATSYAVILKMRGER